MIESLLGSVLSKLADEAFKKFRQIQEVGEKVEMLTCELGRIRTFLKDADQKKIKNEGQKLWLKELINMAYDIEDVIDNALLLEVIPHGNTSHIMLRNLKDAQKLPALSKLCDQIDKILARIGGISNSKEMYGISTLGEGSGEETMLPLKPLVIPDIDDPNIVGFDIYKDNIVEILLDKNTQWRSVLSIVGIGGLGKTSLARKVYNSNDVKANFDLRMWVTVSQKFELIDIIRKILEQIEPIDSNEQGKGTQYFLTQLYGSLVGKKYLLILDDVWTHELWNHIEEALVDANNGSRVLITSRDENVAKAANPSFYPYKLPFLSEEHGLQLLLKKARYNPHHTNNAHSHYLLDIAKKLVKKCCGLPLALVVLGGLLPRNPHEYFVWNNFLRTMTWSIDGSQCANILAISYDDLPLALKLCFMYFAAFPEDYKINALELTRMWIAEEFIPKEKNRTLEDTACRFLNDLAQRSMIQVSERSYDDSIKYCQVHDLLHDLAVEKAKEVNFFTVCSKADEEQRCREARRVAVHYADCDGLLKYASPSLRTLLCFNSRLPNCSQHKLLKVLSDMRMSSRRETTHPSHIEGLTQLRYLRLHHNGCEYNEPRFAKLINNMKFLQTINRRHIQFIKGLIDFIWDIESLRHVMLPGRTFGPPSGSNLRNLHTLTRVKNRMSWDTATVPNLPNLFFLAIRITQGFSSKVVAAFLCKLKSLVELDISLDNIPQDVFDMRGFPFYQQLNYLRLNGKFYHDMGVTIDAAMFPIHLTVLNLYNCRISQDLMAILEKLYNLNYLFFTDGIDECIKKIKCSARGFPKLQSLYVYKAEKLEEWEIEEGAMPMLQVLGVQGCPVLWVPLGLQYLTTLCHLTWTFWGDLYETTKAENIRNFCKHVRHLDV